MLTLRSIESVFVVRRQEPLESGVGGAPARVLQVVARAVDRAVLLVEAHVGALLWQGAPEAAAHVGDQVQVRRGHDLLVCQR